MSIFSELNANYDLLTLVEHSVPLKKSGAYHTGPCPFCGGKDRFNLKSTPTGWAWFCRKCANDKYHTPIDYIMRLHRLPNPLAALPFMTSAAAPSPSPDAPPPQPAANPFNPFPKSVDSPLWQQRAQTLIDQSMLTLWWGPDPRPLQYLLHTRRLTAQTIFYNYLGFNPHDRCEPGPAWGLPADRKVWLPRGITLPCFDDHMQLGCLKFRRAAGKNKYVKLAGSSPSVFGYRNLRGASLIALAEGELDCLTLEQTIGDLAGVCTLGSASDPLQRLDLYRWGLPFIAARAILAFYDNDDAGRQASAKLGIIHKVIPIDLPQGYKDINEMHCAGVHLADWFCRSVEDLGLAGGLERFE